MSNYKAVSRSVFQFNPNVASIVINREYGVQKIKIKNVHDNLEKVFPPGFSSDKCLLSSLKYCFD